MYAQVCFGNYLFKLFKEKHMSKHPYQYFLLRLQLLKMYIFKPQLQAKSPKPFIVFQVSNQSL